MLFTVFFNVYQMISVFLINSFKNDSSNSENYWYDGQSFYTIMILSIIIQWFVSYIPGILIYILRYLGMSCLIGANNFSGFIVKYVVLMILLLIGMFVTYINLSHFDQNEIIAYT